MAISKSVAVIRVIFLKLLFRALRVSITRKWLDDARAKDTMTSLNVHPGLVKRPDLIFANAISRHEPLHQLKESVKQKTVIYTCLTNGYDDLSPPVYQDPNVDYIVFTDNPDLEVEGWIIRVLDNPFALDARRLSRLPKILPHRFFPDYTHSIYVDANLTIMGDLLVLLSYLDTYPMAVFEHPDGRCCMYDEATVVIEMKKDSERVINAQMSKYRSLGFPINFGMNECCILLRSHRNQLVMQCMETWWNELLEHSHRDQLSFSYSRWKTGLIVKTIKGNVRHNDLIAKRGHI